MTSADIPNDTGGDIITFYSYKGGTGRTMALSNVACIMAKYSLQDKGVLLIDWDLEAPGLHRFFFQNKFYPSSSSSTYREDELEERPGLIDLFLELNAALSSNSAENDEVFANDVLDKINLERFIVETPIPNISMLKAGCFDKNYSDKVNTFNWERLYNNCPSLIRLFAEKLSERYRYVLIDSRTGYTDISGICTMLMPQKLVVVFTPNRQSYTGIEKLIGRAIKYRRRSDDLRPLLVYPLPSRIEFSRDDLRAYWRFGNPEQGITGYQPLFEAIFKQVYGLKECNMREYFEEVQIQQSPNYAYGEEIAVINEKSKDSFSISRSYEIFTKWLVSSTAPWQREQKPDISSLPSSSLPSIRGEKYLYATEQGGVQSSEKQLHSEQLYSEDQSREKLENIIKKNPNDSKAYNSLGNYYFRNEKDYNKAIEQYKIAIEKDPKSYIYYVNIGDSFTQLRNFEQAINWYQKALNVRKDDDITLNSLANAQVMLGQYDDAIDSYKKALKVNPTATYYVNLGDTYKRKRNFDEAIVQYENALIFDKNVSFVYDALGDVYVDIYYSKGNDKSLLYKAIDNYNQSLAIQPDNAQTCSTLAECYYLLQNYDEAIVNYKKASELDKINSTYMANIGYMYFWKGDKERALEYYNKALKVEPDNITALKYIGDFNKASKKFDQAIEYYERYLEKYPNNTDVLRALSEIHTSSETEFPGRDLSKAEKYAMQAITIEPDNILNYIEMAYVYKLKGDFDNAINSLNRAAKLNDKDAEVQTGLGDIYMERLNFAEAIRHFETAAKLDPDNPSPYSWLSITYSRVRNWQKAFENAEMADKKARAKNPSDNTYAAYMARVHHDRGLDYYNRGELDNAIEEYKNANTIREDAVTYYNLYLCYRYKTPSSLNEAREAILKAIQLSPRMNPSYTDALAELDRLGRISK